MTSQDAPEQPRLAVVVLASGSGTLLQALLDDVAADPAAPYRVVAVGSDVAEAPALARAEASGVPGFVCRRPDHPSREAWDQALAAEIASYEPGLVVLAGFMKLVGPAVLGRFGDSIINSHPSLLPSFPGMHAPADALAHGVKVTGCTIFTVDEGVDSGVILAQEPVPVLPGDSALSLHERIKVVERDLLVAVVRAIAGDA